MLRILTEKPAAAAFASLVFACILIAGVKDLSINADARVFFSKTNANRQAMDAFDARYEQANNLLIALHAQDGDVYTEERLNAIRALTDALWLLPYATRVESPTNTMRLESTPDEVVVDKTVTAEIAADPERARANIMEDALLLGRLAAPDGKTVGVNVTLDYPMGSSSVTGEIMAAARRAVVDAGVEASGMEAWYGGRVANSSAFSAAGKADMTTLLPLSFAVIFGLLVLILRSPTTAGMVFGVGFVAALSAMGVAGWAGLQINAGTAHMPTLIIALSVAALMHIVLAARRAAVAGAAPGAAVRSALRTDAAPVALTLGSTSVGFLSL
ncbi:MAG: MMPL family transporter, partial [Pseudomonadota bacterium]